MVNKQSGVGDSKYVVISDPILTGHVMQRIYAAAIIHAERMV